MVGFFYSAGSGVSNQTYLVHLDLFTLHDMQPGGPLHCKATRPFVTNKVKPHRIGVCGYITLSAKESHYKVLNRSARGSYLYFRKTSAAK